MNRTLLMTLTLALAGCTQPPRAIRVTNDPPPAAIVQAKPRSEPVFYNGKNYKLDFGPSAGGGYAIAVSGMSAKQEKDAVNLSRSAFHHFVCKDSQKANLLSKPAYADGKWSVTAQCG